MLAFQTWFFITAFAVLVGAKVNVEAENLGAAAGMTDSSAPAEAGSRDAQIDLRPGGC